VPRRPGTVHLWRHSTQGSLAACKDAERRDNGRYPLAQCDSYCLRDPDGSRYFLKRPESSLAEFAMKCKAKRIRTRPLWTAIRI
jgi:hypothetical protein